MEAENKQERSLELRSEKVRSIVGQIPSSLVRYGITVIAVVLMLLVGVAYLLPYKQVFSGTATIQEVGVQVTDSIKVNILLRFEHKRPQSAMGQTIDLHTENGHIRGKALIISPIRDTLDRQEAICHFATQDLSSLAHQTLDFSLVYSQGNLLQKLLGDIGL